MPHRKHIPQGTQHCHYDPIGNIQKLSRRGLR